MSIKNDLKLVQDLINRLNLPYKLIAIDPIIEPEAKPDKKLSNSLAKEVIDYLNKLANTNFKSNSKANTTIINARSKEGYVFDDFKIVINNKVKDWKGTSFEQYLRPITLFAPSKFENYLNQVMPKNKLLDILTDDTWE